MVKQLSDFASNMEESELLQFASDYYIPYGVHPVVPDVNVSIADFPAGKVGVYKRFFEWANKRVPFSLFMCDILCYYSIHISQLHCIGAGKITNFEVNCRLLAINPTVNLFRAFYHTTWSNGWVSFAKRHGKLQCYTMGVDSLRGWREKFFWVDQKVFPWDFDFYTRGSLPKDECPPPEMYNTGDAHTIDTNRIPINSYPEAFLIRVGISRNYFGFDDEMPMFLDANDQGGCSSVFLHYFIGIPFYVLYVLTNLNF